ncbi:hypothetical protein ABZ942_35650 [Nocardia sp. NPDC046473]|uniref:hypothetical protein n=1 Tax=Nocardia sp. NPDC046473 TaxID=3155733 RepID=UPI0033C8EA44
MPSKATAWPPPEESRPGDKLANASVTHWNLLLDTMNRNPHYHWVRDSAVLIERIQAFIDTNS